MNHFCDTNFPICKLEAKNHFSSLNQSNKLYAHHLIKASWYGTLIILSQTSPNCNAIYDFIMSVFSTPEKRLRNLNELKQNCGLTELEFTFILEYCCQFLSNLANYRSFGDSKFIPRVSKEIFEKFVKNCGNPVSLELFEKCKEDIFSVEPESVLSLGYPDDGNIIGYYSSNITKDEIKLVQSFCESIKFDPLNSRLFKKSPTEFEIRVASASILPSVTHSYQNLTIHITYGDFSAQLQKISEELKQALPFASNTHQTNMLSQYISHFQSGSIEEHKESQRSWILDIGPVVETNIGFVETYRDPAGIRAEFEGFVAVVNKEMTKKFEKLVQEAPKFIQNLPWGSQFEKDVFLKPDFTSLEVVTFATGGIPAGINIPNYDDIRQTFGFKNVSLGNVLNAKAANEKINFISKADLPLFEKLRGPAFEVQVGIHELLGHGTGKLFQQNADGSFNFSKDSPPVDPLTGKPISQWYKVGETYNGNFKEISSSYEECRAESVAMFLSTYPEMLSIFGFHSDAKTPESVDPFDVTYIIWLQMARAGISALEFYFPNQNKWGQAHMQARYAILQVLLRAGGGLLTITDKGENADEEGRLFVQLDKSKILTIGVPAMRDFLLKLQVYKSTGDGAGGMKLYSDYTAVSGHWLNWREEVLKRKQPRKVFVQGNTFKVGNDVEFREYDSTLEGILTSFVERDI